MTDEQRQEEQPAATDAPRAAEVMEETLAQVLEQEGEEEAVDEVASLSQQLEEARAKEAEYLDGWQRARAEYRYSTAPRSTGDTR